MGIESLKIEGRMKSADYVFQVAKGYRIALDEGNVSEAAKILRNDMGREKTDYFMGNEVGKAITENPNTGISLGNVIEVDKNWFKIETDEVLSVGNRLRVRDLNNVDRKSLKIKEIEKDGAVYKIGRDNCGVKKGDKVFLAGIRLHKYSSKLSGSSSPIRSRAPRGLVNKAFKSLKPGKPFKCNVLFVRIDSLTWLRKLHFDSVDGVIINLPREEWTSLKLNAPFLLKNKQKLFFEFPKFISEKSIGFFKNQAGLIYKAGFRNFMLSHLSQKELLPNGALVHTNENVYLYNDAAVTAIKEEGVKNYTFPLENDLENLCAGEDREGFVPVYFYPHLFCSRMPVRIENKENCIKDDRSNEFRREVRDGISYTIPLIPVSLLQYGSVLRKNGFRRFLIDLSFEKPSKHILKKLITRLAQSGQVQPSSNFNFKMGLK
jgi:putative protease